MDIQQLAQEKEFAPFHSEDIQKFSEEWLLDASSGISLKKNSSKESLKRKLRMCLQDIPSHRYLRISYFDNTYSGDTRKHRSTVLLLRKMKEKLTIQHHMAKSPHSATKHRSSPFQPDWILPSALNCSLEMCNACLLLTFQGNMRWNSNCLDVVHPFKLEMPGFGCLVRWILSKLLFLPLPPPHISAASPKSH